MRRFLWVLISAVLLPGFSNAQSLSDVEQRAMPSLPDIAVVRFPPGQSPVIYYNPHLCLRAGKALCEFYRYHEYAHIKLRHNERKDLTLREKERQADEWAARHAPFASVMAAYRFFSSGGGGTPMHGSSSSRAARILKGSEQIALSDEAARDEQPQLPSRTFMP